MQYEFRCDKCKRDFEVSAPMKDGPGKAVCPECGIPAHRKFSLGVQVPDHMRATGDPVHNFACDTMRHAKRPSGKGKVIY